MTPDLPDTVDRFADGPDVGEPPPPPCLHGDGKGLCESCREEFEIDPGAYEEFGEHAEGRRRWEALRAEVAAYHAAAPAADDPTLPW